MLAFFQTESDLLSSVPLLLTHIAEDYEQEPVDRPYGALPFQFFLSRSGEGELRIRGERMVVKPGDCFLIHPGISHSYRAAAGKWIVANIGITGNICPSLFETLGFSRSGIYDLSDPKIFLRHLNRIRRLTEKSTDQMDWTAACYEFLLSLSRVSSLRPVNDPLIQKISQDSYAYRTLQYLESHLKEPVSIVDIAENLGINHQYLCTVFKKETGMTIIQYLQRLRIGRARMMLERFPEKSAAQIGSDCGFDSPSYFGLQFKKVTGFTPDQYRKKGTVISQE